MKGALVIMLCFIIAMGAFYFGATFVAESWCRHLQYENGYWSTVDGVTCYTGSEFYYPEGLQWGNDGN